MNFYKHHLGDYEAATAHLSWDEDCAYRRLMAAYYRREKPLPVDSTEIYRLVRATAPKQRAAVDSVLREFFDKREDGWHNKRCDEELSSYLAQCEVNRRVGKLGGRPKRTGTVTPINRTGTEPEPNRIPNQIPEPDTRSQNPEGGSLAVKKLINDVALSLTAKGRINKSE